MGMTPKILGALAAGNVACFGWALVFGDDSMHSFPVYPICCAPIVGGGLFVAAVIVDARQRRERHKSGADGVG